MHNFRFSEGFNHHFQIVKRDFDGNWYKKTIINNDDQLSLPVEGFNDHFFSRPSFGQFLNPLQFIH